MQFDFVSTPVNSTFLILCVLIVLLIAVIIMLAVRLYRISANFERESRRRIDTSRSVLLGQVAEQFAPVLPGFEYNPKDAHFIGQPIDYVIFDGMNDEHEITIVLCEIKSGGARLSSNEKAIRDAVAAGRVRFETLRVGSDGHITRDK